MQDFRIDGCNTQSAANSNHSYNYGDYVSKPEWQSTNVFDDNYVKPQQNHKWLDDFGWL